MTTGATAAAGDAAAIATVTLASVAKIMAKLKMYPYFDIANYILMCTMVREDDRPTADGQVLSRRHPLASWISSMLMCFASIIMVNLILGEPPIAPFTNHRDLITASVVWYAINYSPFDIFYKICKFTPIKIIIYCLKEIQRAHKVHHGVHFASKVFPDAYVVICVVGVLKGAGYYYMRLFERLVRGTWTPTSNEILQPTLATKACLIASLLFIFEDNGLIHLHHHELYLGVIAFFILGRLAYLLIHIHNPFLLFENLISAVFFGGLFDAIRRAITSRSSGASSAAAPTKADVDAAGGSVSGSGGSAVGSGTAQSPATSGTGSKGQQTGKSKDE